ncbi:zinc-alpha-2-glycoprotein-like isoform X1 [Conger conger]|uniref:zinc-alpha-2-glycoprotein-like isoform X1 n=1 Tax=Conger conger TaxID=82655 RepID=UPI002A59C7F1|nr:zinc-alpha-2-glycoprotein-like isoform X1 [Conger conger]
MGNGSVMSRSWIHLYNMFRDMSTVFFGICAICWIEAVCHSLVGTYTALSTREYTAVLYLDGEPLDSYSSSGVVSMPRRAWMREGPGRYIWNSTKGLNMQQWGRGMADIFNHTGPYMSAVVLQGRFGCRIEREPHVSVTEAFAQYGLNGEDFLYFELTRHQWVASAESALPIAKKWNRDQNNIMETEKNMKHICMSSLLDSLSMEEKESQKTFQPNASVFAKLSRNSGKVILTCLVSGFRCGNTTVEVYRDEDILTEDNGLWSSGIRPNGDGTCQLRRSLDISNSTEAPYSCGVHSTNLTVKWDGVIWGLAETRQDHITRHHDVLIVPFAVFLIFTLTLRCRRHSYIMAWKSRGCLWNSLMHRCNPD